jgi:RpiB/LacA/LacB family sugar-phosphate isomerase
MHVVIGADHRGYNFKKLIIDQINNLGGQLIEWIDVGCFSAVRCEYPPFSYAVAQTIKSGKAQRGVLLCGTGVGMSIAANRFAGIYAALVWNQEVAIRSAQEDYSNVLVIPADYLAQDEIIKIITAWLQTQPRGGKYHERIALIDQWGGL